MELKTHWNKWIVCEILILTYSFEIQCNTFERVALVKS